MTEQDIGIFLLHVRGIYSRFVIEPPVTPNGDSPTVAVWRACLADMALPDAVEALIQHGQASKWPPTPADIRELDPHKWRRDYGSGRELALGSGTAPPSVQQPHVTMVYRVWSAAADDYLALPEPRPYREEIDGREARVRRFAGEVLPGDPVPGSDRVLTVRYAPALAETA